MSDQSTGGTYRRPWIAIGLTLLVPGLGHLYLREWIRSAAWFLTYFLSTTLIPDESFPEEFSREAFVAAAEATPLWVSSTVLFVAALCIVDAYVLAKRANRERTRGADATVCPNCGKEIDGDLEFCHWCTTPLQDQDGETDSPSR